MGAMAMLMTALLLGAAQPVSAQGDSFTMRCDGEIYQGEAAEVIVACASHYAGVAKTEAESSIERYCGPGVPGDQIQGCINLIIDLAQGWGRAAIELLEYVWCTVVGGC